MTRVEAVIFAASEPVSRELLSQIVGRECSIDLLIEDIASELTARPYEIVAVAGGWQFRTRPRQKDLWRFRVLGAIIPDLDHIIAEYQEHLPTPAKPILPLHLRPALLAGIAIVERAGPEMLRMLRGHMMGDNRVRFTDAAENIIARARRSRASSQMQLI